MKKRCDLCKFWTPRTDIGYCEKNHDDKVDSNDCCDLHESEEKKKEK